jgi:sodium pump decarboxylase gamma subunit
VSLVEQGLVLMVTGMAVVFVFLVILVFSTKTLSAVVTKYFTEKEKPVKRRPQTGGGTAEAEIAAAVAAVAAYSQR